MRAKKPYHKRRPSKKQIELLCGEAGPEDGIDPRDDRPGSTAAKHGRKALQLCRQVRRALEFALAECRDSELGELNIVSVEPAPHSGRLLVTLQLSTAEVETSEVLTRLEGAAGKLRCVVASAIHRRKTPELAFCVLARPR